MLHLSTTTYIHVIQVMRRNTNTCALLNKLMLMDTHTHTHLLPHSKLSVSIFWQESNKYPKHSQLFKSPASQTATLPAPQCVCARACMSLGFNSIISIVAFRRDQSFRASESISPDQSFRDFNSISSSFISISN